MNYIVALDQGTTSSRALVFDAGGRAIASHSVEFRQLYPQPGWVEHDPEEIYESQLTALKCALEKSGIDARDIEAVGITNQRETTILWERATGRPVHNAIVWQCRRSADMVERLKRGGHEPLIRSRTGLIPDAYFSASKLMWMFENLPGLRERAGRGELCFGTVDSYLAYRLSGGNVHATDASNASRTMLFNIHEGRWDEELLAAMGIPKGLILPEVVGSSQVIGVTDPGQVGFAAPIASLAGDQHAALFGQGCFSPGMAKNTYGTGCFLLMNTGEAPRESSSNLITTVAWMIDGKITYALEGSVFVAGAAVKWLRDELKIISSSSETGEIAASLEDNGGVYMVPAFSGLGAPHWDMYSRGTIIGLTGGAGRAHVVRAALEAIAYQTRDVLDAMVADCGIRPDYLRADGGASVNGFLMQFQSDILDLPIHRPAMFETTAKGAAMLAGRAVGRFGDAALRDMAGNCIEYYPSMGGGLRDSLYSGWKRAVARAEGWAKP